LARLVGESLGGLATVAETHRRIWTTVVAAVPEGAAALVVGHGGGIEPGPVACLPDADPELWGAPFGHCDGARLGFDGGRFVSRPVPPAPVGAAARGCQGGWAVAGAVSPLVIP
jgi:hypothetical protein